MLINTAAHRTRVDSFDFTPLQDEIFPRWARQFKSGDGPGEYSYARGGPTSLYGTTDILIGKYITGELDGLGEDEKDAWAATINQFQDPGTGKYVKTYTMHFWEHTTAYAVAALRLIDRRPTHPMAWKDAIIASPRTMHAWTRQWRRAPWSLIWSGSHVWSGVPAALAMTGEGSDVFFSWYFDWFDAHVDPASGFWRRGLKHKLVRGKPGLHDMAGAFHMHYMYEYLGRQWPHPERVVDWTLALQLDHGLWGHSPDPYCRDLDGLYCLTRSSRNAGGYKAGEVRAAVVRFLETTHETLNDPAFVFTRYTSSHKLVGALAAIAECQLFFPDLVTTPRPWRQSLDVACYI